MSQKQLHLVRHGEVLNPDGVLYGRLPEFHLSERGARMAALAAADLAARGRTFSAVHASPLVRAQESAAPIAEALQLAVGLEPRIIEPTNQFEGMPNHGASAGYRQPRNWRFLWNPLRPSWGEPYRSIANRMLAAMEDAWESQPSDVVFVSHQSPIWMAHLRIAGKALFHDPRTRRCELSSITTFERRSGVWHEVGYVSPAGDLLHDAIDVGAV